MEHEIDDIEELKRWIATVVQNAGQADAKRLKQALDEMLAGAAQIGDILSSRCTALAKRCRPRKAKPPKSSPASGPQKDNDTDSSTDTPNTQNDAEDQPQTKSRIMQGIQQSQAEPTMADQRRVALGKIYGAQNNDVAFNKAAKVIAS